MSEERRVLIGYWVTLAIGIIGVWTVYATHNLWFYFLILPWVIYSLGLIVISLERRKTYK